MTQSRQEKPKASIFQSLITGMVAGATEVLIDHPLWTIKTRKQRKLPFTLQPQVLYRGILPNAASMVPTTAVQVALDSSFKHVFFKDNKELSYPQRITSAFVAGVGSALVSCPTEMILTHLGENKGSFYTVAKALTNQAGWRGLFTGLTTTAVRDGTFTPCYLAGAPILKANIRPYFSNDYAATLASCIVAGLFSTIATQGIDTIKTTQQGSSVLKPLRIKDAAVKIYSTDGIYGFFKGGVARGARVTSAVTIMGWVKETMDQKFSHR
jgi:hypothetical protein